MNGSFYQEYILTDNVASGRENKYFGVYMITTDITLSSIGKQIFESALNSTLTEWKDYRRTRTVFFYYNQNYHQVEYKLLREYIGEIIQEFNLQFPFNDRDSDYSLFLNQKLFDLFVLRLNRDYFRQYVIVTRNDHGKHLFIIRDYERCETKNIRLIWDDETFQGFHTEQIPFYFTCKDMK